MKEALFNTKTLLLDILDKHILGVPLANGTPRPYCSGKRFREKLVETDSDNFVWTFYSQQDISSIDTVYERDDDNHLWVATTKTVTKNTSAKTVVFDTDPTGQVAIDVTVNSTEHPIEIIKDILASEVGLRDWQYDVDSLNTIKTLRGEDVACGVRFEKMSALQAIKLLAKFLDSAIFIEGETLKMAAADSPTPTGISIGRGNFERGGVERNSNRIINMMRIPYGDFADDKSKIVSASDLRSIYDYGVRDLSKFYPEMSFTYQDPVSSDVSGDITALLTTLIERLPQVKEVYRLRDIYLEAMRIEPGDQIALTDDFLGLSGQPVIVSRKKVDFGRKRADLSVVNYPIYSRFFYNDAEPPEPVYFVDTPVPATQDEYKGIMF